MKHQITIFLIIIVSILSCKKDSTSPYWGEATAKLNGVEWEGRPYAGINKPYDQGIDLVIDVFNDQDFLREEVYIYKIPNEVGVYPIKRTSVREIDDRTGAKYFTAIDDGHIDGDRFNLLNDFSLGNQVSITKKEGSEIWGEFQVIYVKDTIFMETQPEIPDTLVFTEGMFHTRIID